MKFKFVYLMFCLAVGAALWSASSNGFGAAQFKGGTGAPNETTCISCHTQGSPATIQTTTTIAVIDTVTGSAVSKYFPGKVYLVRVTVNKATGNPLGYGFQIVSLLNSGNVDVKGWQDPKTDVQIITLPTGSKRSYAEHDKPSNNNFFEVKWKAPVAGKGKVTFYACGNGVNRNGNISGDGASVATLTLDEGTTAVNEPPFLLGFEVFPNPVQDQLQAAINLSEGGTYALRLINLDGRVEYRETAILQAGNNPLSFGTAHLPRGVYLLQLSNGRESSVRRVVKF